MRPKMCLHPNWIQLLQLHPCPSAHPGPNPAHPGPVACFEACLGAVFRAIEEQLQGEACEYAGTRTHRLIKQNKIQNWSAPAR